MMYQPDELQPRGVLANHMRQRAQAQAVKQHQCAVG